jgi:FkbH-like protein
VLQEAGLFDTLSLSAEDRRRGELYRQREQAEAARGTVATVEDYYRDLAMELAIAPIGRATLPRAAQLTQKTNQFNVTTRRYSEAEVSARMGDPGWIATTFGVSDRFGDNGIVGVLMARHAGRGVEIDTLLLSCRVIGRTVETAMLAHLCDEALSRGAIEILAVVVPTPKNVPARDVFERHGFDKIGEDAAGTATWRLDLAGGGIAWPAWFRRAQ